VAAVVAVARREPAENGVSFEVCLCLSRACLAKMIIFAIKSAGKRPFSRIHDRELAGEGGVLKQVRRERRA
jgi:hypothetical protein